jgi:FkbH-like protein
MRLAEALQIAGKADGERERSIHLLCGFMPLHFETFTKAHLKLRFPEDRFHVRTGLYADLEGSIQRARESGNGEVAIAVIEWADLDHRLGFRASAGWSIGTLEDVVGQIEEKCRRLEMRLAELAEAMPVTVVSPTLGLPPLTHVPPAQISVFELRLNAILAQFLKRVGEHPAIKLVSNAALALNSAPAVRHDIKMDLAAGFPYTLAHADAVAKVSVSCAFPTAPKKGIITDLDQTLWKGILGDAGAEGVSWSLEDKSQVHGLYQQLLASLADSGVLLAIVSKNDPPLVEAALQRSDILVKPSQVFPVEAGWGVKSDSVGRVLKAWNVGADSVIFVDDSPMELAEVSEKYPGIECLRFPSGDPAAIMDLLLLLRARFGKTEVREEDRLRLASLRANATLSSENTAEASPDFLSRLGAKITFEAAGADQRAFELVNKTNQFNLNGVRYTEAEWKALSARPGAFLAIVSYEDRFGPLGRIGVVGGYKAGDRCCVDIWVISCRAFSRQIEFQTLVQLFDKTGASAIRFGFKPTERNGPLQTFFAHFFGPAGLGESELELFRVAFEGLCPPLFHQVNDKWTLSEKN